MSEPSDNLINDPFADDAHSETPSESDSHELLLERNARLYLTDSGLKVYDPGVHPRLTFCGLSLRPSSALQTVPYHNILSATLTTDPSGPILTIIHALPTSKSAVRPSYITYPLPKTSVPTAERLISTLLSRAYPPRVQRQKRIKVLINPLGGRGLAPTLYARDVEPILLAAGCDVDVETTTHVGHAKEIAAALDTDRYDVIACCSGDGTPHEVFNGLALHERPRRALRKVAVAQLPCGSGNAMCRNLLGTDSPSVAALALVKGERRALDLMRISQGEQRYWSFLSQSVGIVAESDLGTDNIRWMGAARFTYGFLVRLLGKTVYPAEVSVKVEAAEKEGIREGYKRKRYGEVNGEEEEQREVRDDEDLERSGFGGISDPVPSDWETRDMPTLGNFYCGNMAWMSTDAPFFAAALPNDGLMDMVNIDGAIKRHVSIKLLLSVEKNQFFNQKEVNYRKVSAYRITPRLRPDQKEGFISVDGERVPFGPLQAEVVSGLGTVLSIAGSAYDFEGPPARNEP
ncbi:diacylglycerol kinase-like protein 1 [Elsinoe australis]|uniref:Diacylglycerol kinase-like protein 1 n=1 Tax=Elsinoe australis TaxID=40998 RepID=A0A4U7B384_9PEZI|nr:diacylglycerol kinase-like protein 1 [Elsinoe australis]